MKSFCMKYGSGNINFEADENNILQILEGNSTKSDKSEEEIIKEALENPIGSARLKELVHEDETVCVIIPDITRDWQKSGVYLKYVIEELNAGGVKDKDILILSATGTHRKQTKEEHEALLGPELSKRFKIMDHDCHDEKNLTYLGKTTFGTPVILNKAALECDHVVLTGGIVYHLLAGWGGGRKYILPGISAYETIMVNHALSLNKGFGSGSNPNVFSGNIINNPVHEDMLQAASFVRPTFMFNVVMGAEGNIAGAVAGNYIDAHAKGREMVNDMDGVFINEKADLVIATAGGYPKDINLYQTIKTLINAREGVKENGTIILISESREGLGGNSEVQDMILNYNSMEEREKVLRDNYSITKYVAYYFCESADKFNLILVSSLDKELLKTTRIKLTDKIEEALNMAYEIEGKDCKILLMPHGANTLPKMKL